MSVLIHMSEWRAVLSQLTLLLFLVPVDQIYTAKPFKSAPAKGMSWSSRPAIIKQVYHIAEPPPALQKLNCFRFVLNAHTSLL